MTRSDARLAALKTGESTYPYSSLMGRSHWDFVHKLIRAHIILIFCFIISHTVFELKQYKPCSFSFVNIYARHGQICLYTKQVLYKNSLSLLLLLWQPKTAQLNPAHIIRFSYMENFYGDQKTIESKWKLESIMAVLIGWAYSEKVLLVHWKVLCGSEWLQKLTLGTLGNFYWCISKSLFIFTEPWNFCCHLWRMVFRYDWLYNPQPKFCVNEGLYN